jgi:hypothetical protein
MSHEAKFMNPNFSETFFHARDEKIHKILGRVFVAASHGEAGGWWSRAAALGMLGRKEEKGEGGREGRGGGEEGRRGEGTKGRSEKGERRS